MLKIEVFVWLTVNWSVNFFSFLNLHKCFWIFLVYLCVGSSSITLAFPSCSCIFLITSPSDKINQSAIFFTIWKLYNSDPIGLWIIVVLSECYLQRLEKKPIALSFTLNISPKTFKTYADENHCRFENKQKSFQFLEILSKQDSPIQYTIEFENNEKPPNFLDINITNNGIHSYDFKIFRKPAITNLQIKCKLNMAPNISFSVYKEFSSRACKICSERYIDEDIQYLIDVFIENGYDRKTLEKIRNDFNELHSEDISKVVKRPWIPITGPKLRQAFRKNNIKTIFRSDPNLKSLLCGNKTKL